MKTFSNLLWQRSSILLHFPTYLHISKLLLKKIILIANKKEKNIRHFDLNHRHSHFIR